MDVALKLAALCPAAQYGGSLTANTEAAYDAIRWEDARPKPTWAALLADTTVEQAAAQASAIASIYAPVAYNGKLYPVDLQSIFKYESAKQSRGRGKLNRGLAIAIDGTVLKLSTPAEIDEFHFTMEDALTARTHAIHDAI